VIVLDHQFIQNSGYRQLLTILKLSNIYIANMQYMKLLNKCRFTLSEIFFLAITGILVFLFVRGLFYRPPAPHYAHKRQECAHIYRALAKNYTKTDCGLLLHIENKISDNFRYYPMTTYLSAGKVNLQLGLVVAVKNRKTGEWTECIPTDRFQFPLIFPIAYYPSDLNTDFGKSTIYFSDGDIRYDWNPTICNTIPLDMQRSNESVWIGKFIIVIDNDDERFCFAKEYSELKIIIPY
jgi:hypothetical protein